MAKFSKVVHMTLMEGIACCADGVTGRISRDISEVTCEECLLNVDKRRLNVLSHQVHLWSKPHGK